MSKKVKIKKFRIEPIFLNRAYAARLFVEVGNRAYGLWHCGFFPAPCPMPHAQPKPLICRFPCVSPNEFENVEDIRAIAN